MNTDYTAKITEIFYSVDEFCKQIEPQFKKKAIGEDRKTDDFLPKLHLFREKVLHFFSGYEAL